MKAFQAGLTHYVHGKASRTSSSKVWVPPYFSLINDYSGMPRTRTKTKPKTKPSKKKGVIRKRVPRTIAPHSKLIRVKCTDFLSPGYTSGAIANYYCQLNSVDDPFAGFSTNQPLGYDQWKTLYQKAYVVGAKAKVVCHNGSTSAIMYGICPMPVSQGSTSLLNYEHYSELPQNKQRLLSPDVDHGVLTHSVSVKKHLQVKDIRDNNDLVIDLINETPPSKLCYWHLYSQPVDQTTTVASGNVQFVITLEYIVLLTDPVVPARSIET